MTKYVQIFLYNKTLLVLAVITVSGRINNDSFCTQSILEKSVFR